MENNFAKWNGINIDVCTTIINILQYMGALKTNAALLLMLKNISIHLLFLVAFLFIVFFFALFRETHTNYR